MSAQSRQKTIKIPAGAAGVCLSPPANLSFFCPASSIIKADPSNDSPFFAIAAARVSAELNVMNANLGKKDPY